MLVLEFTYFVSLETRDVNTTMKDAWLRKLIDVALLGIAIVLVVVVVRTYKQPGSSTGGTVIAKSDWSNLRAGGSAMGDPDADVTLVEFVDYQCPVCEVMEHVVADIELRYPDRVRRVLRHFPLPNHPAAAGAAAAAECAREQGKLKEMHAVMFKDQSRVADSAWVELARLIGLQDTTAFRSCIDGEAVRRVIEADIALARRLGVSATPTFVIDGNMIDGVKAPVLRKILLDKLDR